MMKRNRKHKRSLGKKHFGKCIIKRWLIQIYEICQRIGRKIEVKIEPFYGLVEHKILHTALPFYDIE